MANEYSPTWHELFGARVDPARTAAETAFLARVLPLPAFRSVLDVACGHGRHLRALAALGYDVLGVERDLAVVPEGARVLDMRELHRLDETFDAAICMWQSFGYFDDATNLEVLRQLAARLRPGGRLVLDVYHRGFFERAGGERTLERDGRTVRESSRLEGDRLRVRLDYGEEFDWRLYTPEELEALGRPAGLGLAVACAGFDEARAPSPEEPRMQLVFERPL